MKNAAITISLSFLLVSFTLTGCSDENLAQNLEGCWTTDYKTIKSEYGNTVYATRLFCFNYDSEATSYDGGKFEEVQLLDIEAQDADGSLIKSKFSINFEVSGTWEVLLGDLYLTYDLSSIVAKIGDVDFFVSKDVDYYTKKSLESIISSLTNYQVNAVREKVEGIMYDSFYRNCKDNNDGELSYKDVKFRGSQMPFETSTGIETYRQIDTIE